MTQTFKTPKGTELPMLDLRGKPYLQVAHRLVWFREEHPDSSIETKLIEHDAAHAIFSAEVHDPNGHLIATAHGHESKSDFPDFIEKAETKAIGRALAMCGYGTQFAPELDEGERLADTPTTPAKPAKPVANRTFSATLDQLRQISALAKAKLGAEKPEDVIPALNEKYSLGIKSSAELSRTVATTLIKTLEAIKTDTAQEQVTKEE